MLPKTLLLGAFLPSALAVSLADFAPRASNLPSACQSVYTSSITMCQPSDFEQRKCSKNCVNALNALRASVNKACTGISGHNILAAMMAGRGTQDLCPNADDYDDDDNQSSSSYAAAPTPSTTTTQAPPPPSSTTTTQPPPPSSTTTTSAPATTSASDSSSTSSDRTTIVFATNTVVPQPSGSEVPTSIVFDSNTPSDVAATASRTSSQAAATSVRDSGSPFGGTEPGMEALAGSGSAIRTEAVAMALAAVVAVMVRL
ncbi:hypothetical protein C1H76_5684 [Elsinoe australis]|uniref:Uncharacterized protein n=1 Tax=Elsinoe australis TaxID=40998 RepID=A0A4U7AYP9_9PEZI|nr:hypothetical protein C1H76_5684 [Elsinoe australis]